MTLEQDMVKFVRSPRFPQTIIERSIPQNRIIIESVASIPREPLDGDEIFYLADATNGVTWRFRYRAGSSSTYKWEFIGGPPLWELLATSESTTSTSYANLATTGPDLTVPLAGDYDITIGATFSSTVSEIAIMSYAIGGAAAADSDSMRMGTGGGDQNSNTRTVRETGISASTAITAKYKSFGGASVTFFDRWMSITPVRIGG